VRAVESAGRGFDADGRPKRLFERHKFHRFTGGRSRPARSASHPPGAIRSMPMAMASTTTGTS
jgi:hypothetical protein